ncbi:MAG: type 4a pilus biogenesis protein PilO [Patescibacteria group bacterium]|nr:type 4a pilus biogenesis protein PilO [Patescibacteria group bacterium]MDD5164306.1 type 4a pilus biogenesis protein PilO [Patescibacteria group bacterium]MDD5534752.1 type 4a pilus biogenesis protein PilO [Patescibacteria group bacterium]
MAKIIEEKKFDVKWYHIILVKFCWTLIIFIIIAAFSFEYFLIIKPKVNQTTNDGQFDVENYKTIVKEQEAYFNKLTALESRTEKISEDSLKKLDYTIAEKSDLPSLLNQIDIISRQTGMKFTEFSVKSDEGITTINLNFDEGDYQSCKEFLDYLEKNIRIMDVSQITLKDAGASLSVIIKTYSLND